MSAINYTLMIPNELVAEIMWHYAHTDELQDLVKPHSVGAMTRISSVCVII